MCGKTKVNLHRHILCGCKTPQTQGHYRWRHHQVLRKLAEATENMRFSASKEPQLVQFVFSRTVSKDLPVQAKTPVLAGNDWCNFPTNITSTSLRPDIVLWSVS